MSDIDDCRKSVERLTRDRGEVMRAGEEKIEEIRARHKAGPLGQMPREDRMSSHLRWRWLLGEVDRRGAEIERLRAEIERLRENVDRAGKEVERADRLRAEIARVKADDRENRAEIKRLRAKVAWLEKHSDEIEAKLEELRWP